MQALQKSLLQCEISQNIEFLNELEIESDAQFCYTYFILYFQYKFAQLLDPDYLFGTCLDSWSLEALEHFGMIVKVICT